MDNYVDQVREAISIVDEISKVTKLVKKGREHTGCCPFHTEKTASFYVNSEKGYYYCFGCSAKGNIFTFYMDYYRLSFRESLESLAKIANIALPTTISYSQDNYKDSYYKICSIFSEFASKNLLASNEAKQYLRERGISKKVVDDFSIGFVPAYYEGFFEDNSSYSSEILDIGLQSFSENKQIYTSLRNRIIFPIKNIKGQIIAFGGRALNNEIKPKYLNTKESKIFSKKNILYGLYQSVRNIRESRPLIIVEGYIDVISLHQYGLSTAVASLGTAIGEEHISLIKKYDKSPVFCLDGDIAGEKATYRVIQICLQVLDVGFNPKFLFLPQGEDPDSFIRKYSVEKFENMIRDAQRISDVLWTILSKGKDLKSPEDKSIIEKSFLEHISNIKDFSLKANFTRFLKDKLFWAGKKNPKIHPQISNTVYDAENISAAKILYCLLHYPSIYDNLAEDLEKISFKNAKLLILKDYFIENYDTLKDSADFSKIIKEACVDEYNYMNGLLKSAQEVLKDLNEYNAQEYCYSAYKVQLRFKLIEERQIVENKILNLLRNSVDSQNQEDNTRILNVLNKQLQQITVQIKETAS